MPPLRPPTPWARKLTLIARPQIALQAAIYTWVGAYLGHGLPIPNARAVGAASLLVALVVAFGFVINDLADRDLDAATKPHRPLPAGALTPGEARSVAAALALAAATLALWLPPPLRAVALTNLGLTAAYSLLLKRTVLLGNLAIGLLNSSILVFGALAAGPVTTLVWAVAVMSFLYTVGQEVLYTVDDLAGDRAAGLVTAPVYFGVGPSLLLTGALFALAVVAALVPWLMADARLPYLFALGVCTAGPLALHILPLIAQGTPESIRRACAAVKVVRVTSLVPLLLLPAA